VFRRHNYTTPKSYLEFISTYKQLLEKKRGQLTQAKQRLESGVDKITSVGGWGQCTLVSCRAGWTGAQMTRMLQVPSTAAGAQPLLLVRRLDRAMLN